MEIERRWVPWVTGALICLTLGVLYFTLRVQIHTFDAISYAWNIRDKAFGLLFHPHHLLYAPLGRFAYLTAQSLGYTGYADAPVQAVNAVAGALGVFLFWRFGARWQSAEWPALGVAALIGVSYAYWLYASEVEVYTIATAFLILCMWLLVVLDEKPEPIYAALLGLAHTGAIMFHQTNALFALPVSAFLLLNRRTRSLPLFLTYAGTGALTTLGVYGTVGLASDFASFPDFFNWFMGYTQSGIWGGYLGVEHLPALGAGLQNAISPNPWVALLIYAAGAAGLIMLIIEARHTLEMRPWLAFSGVWLVVYGLFFWWWEPWNIEFWIALLPLLGLFLLIPLRMMPPTLHALPFAMVIALSAVNRPPISEMNDRANDYYFRLTQTLTSDLTSDDLVVTRGNVLDIYLPFYAEHPVVLSMREVTFGANSDRGAVMGEVTARLDWARNTGQVVQMEAFLFEEPLGSGQNPFGFTLEEIDHLRARYPWEVGAQLDGQPAFYRFPRYADPEARAWGFADNLAGWYATGVGSPRFERGGWCITGGGDPQLSGPTLELEAGTIDEIVLDITLDAPQSTAELFWRSPENDYALERSVQVDLSEGRQVYRVPTAGLPGWQGPITELRLDPIPGEAEATVCLQSIELR